MIEAGASSVEERTAYKRKVDIVIEFGMDQEAREIAVTASSQILVFWNGGTLFRLRQSANGTTWIR